MKRNIVLVCVSALLVLTLAGQPAEACDVPVFRYALENWPSDPFLAVIFHRGALTAEQRKVAELLRNSAPRANVLVYTVDLNGTLTKPTQALWDKHKTDELPLLVVTFALPFGPAYWGRQSPVGHVPFPPAVWVSPLTASNVKAVIDSPARQEIAKRLLAGETAVWVLSESGDKKADDDAEKLITAELAKATKLLALPPQEDAEGPDAYGEDQPAGPPLKIAFSVLRISRGDPVERMLTTTLIRSEDDLEVGKYSKQPMVFPIFGRGRSLYALVGKGIHTDNIMDACGFLTGPCSCQIKGQNPGIDLLIAADWDKALGYVMPETIDIPLTSLSAQPETVPTTAPAASLVETPTTMPAISDETPSFRQAPPDVASALETPAPAPASGSSWKLILQAAGIGLGVVLLLAALTVVITRRKASA